MSSRNAMFTSFKSLESEADSENSPALKRKVAVVLFKGPVLIIFMMVGNGALPAPTGMSELCKGNSSVQ